MSDAGRRAATAIFAAAVEAAHPAPAVATALAVDPMPADAPMHVLAFGKAACAMAAAVLGSIPPAQVQRPALCVTDAGNATDVEGGRVLVAGHPLPDAAGLAAAEEVAERLRLAPAQDTVLALVSGGSSALLPAPVAGVSLDDKVLTTRLLLESGATIHEVNIVRKHLSFLKGGGMCRLAYPAAVRSLILSDVLDDDPSAIGSGPTVPDSTTYGDAVEIIRRYRLPAPTSVTEHLQAGMDGRLPETPKPGDPVFSRSSHLVIGGNAVSLAVAAETAEGLGYRARLIDRRLQGEARVVAAKMVEAACAGRAPAAMLWGGETTVTVRGAGQGGRNQELALAFVLAARQHRLSRPFVLLSAGTDGRDGPTDAAGGMVDQGTLDRIRAAGLEPLALLDDNDSHRALAAAGDLLITGPTGTNVADLQILLLGDPPRAPAPAR